MKFNLNKYQFFSGLILLTILILPNLVLAADFGLQNPISVDSISGLIRIVVKVIRYIAIPFVVIAIMWVGWLFIYGSLSKESKKLQEAKDGIQYVLLGAFILLSAELIAIVMENTIKTLSK